MLFGVRTAGERCEMSITYGAFAAETLEVLLIQAILLRYPPNIFQQFQCTFVFSGWFGDDFKVAISFVIVVVIVPILIGRVLFGLRGTSLRLRKSIRS